MAVDADAVFQTVLAAHASAAHAPAVFPHVTRVASHADDGGAFVTARFGAADGGAWLLRLLGEAPCVTMLYCAADGGLPAGFIDDMCEMALGVDLDGAARLPAALNALLRKAAILYNKMNGEPLVEGATGADAAGGAQRAAVADAAAAAARDNAAAQSSGKAKTLTYQEPDFSPSPLATATLTKQLSLLSQMDTMSMGFSIMPVDDNLYQWQMLLFYSDPSTLLYKDLQEHPTQKHVEMELRFPSGYPCEPPFCRVVSPAFCTGTGYVQSHGGICMELLTGAGWTPANSMDAVAVQIHSFLTTGKGRLDTASPGRVKNYTLAGALRDMSLIVSAHSWDVSNARVAKARKRPRGEGPVGADAQV